jgi:hypothetical protein
MIKNDKWIKEWLKVKQKEKWAFPYDNDHNYVNMVINLSKFFNPIINGGHASPITTIF